MRFRYALLAQLTVAAVGQAQLVRGVVTERASGVPLGGVLVTLLDSTSHTVGSVLSTEAGDFAVRAPGPGRYHVDAKRIGVRRYSSPVFELSASETRRLDVSLDALLYALPEVVITAVPLCVSADRDAGRVASLWDEARTALTAAQISQRDRLFKARLVRYVREVDPASLRVLSETRSDVQGVVDRPFYSLPAESLSARGFWRRESDASTLYYAPDAEVLLSESFLDDHCFKYARPAKDRPGLVGLGFEPEANRTVGEVRGTLWLDAKTFELRFVEYRYTRLDDVGADSAQIGGEVHFARLRSGAWIVRRWFIRMPQFGRSIAPPVGLTSTAPSVLVRPVVFRLREEGGDVTAEGLRVYERPSTISGVVEDSARRPLVGARVRLQGTPYETVTNASGSFLLDSLPAGAFDVVVEHPDYDALGMPAALGDVSLKEGDTKRISFRSADTRDIVARLCLGRRPDAEHATLRVNVQNEANGNPLAFITLTVTWNEYASGGGTVLLGTREVSGTSDSRGGVAFCDLPADTPLSLSRRVDRERAVSVDSLRLGAGSVSTRLLRAPPPARP
ncbi:MAG: carboxypeptidase-like regulatory domain-containing protein [Gemmatimonadaceae bacterium]